MRILVTGATGFIGNHLLPSLRHHTLHALTRKSSRQNNEKIHWIEADLSQSDLNPTLPENFDAILYLAQSKHYREVPAKTWDIFNVNVRSLLWMLEYARSHQVKKFIYTSSANVYRRSPTPIAENGALEPHTLYGQSKRMGEMLVESYSPYFDCIILRLFTVYGPGQSSMLIPALIERVVQNQPVQVSGREGLLLSPVFVGDLCEILHAALEEINRGPGLTLVNVGGDERISILRLVKLIGDILGREPLLEFLSGEEPDGWVADNTKMKSLFKIGSLTSIRDGLAQTIARL